MSESGIRYPKVVKSYQRFLGDENSAQFIASVSDSYTLGTLSRIFQSSDRVSRRAAILAIGFLGDFEQNDVMGQALADDDRAVRLLAEHNIRRIWQRQGSSSEQELIGKLEQLNQQSNFESVVDLATLLIGNNDQLGEAWNQRAIAWSTLGEYQNTVDDCRITLLCNRYHFPAAVGMGRAYLELEDVFRALDSFRIALKINPDLENLRSQIRKLEQIVEGRG